jgi:hypothetical protein
MELAPPSPLLALQLCHQFSISFSSLLPPPMPLAVIVQVQVISLKVFFLEIHLS